MFLHLGSDTVVALRDVIAINDLKSFRSGINKDFIKNMREKKLVVDISSDNAKSFIVTDKKIFLSAISSLTLKKRAGTLLYGEDDD
ncbi:DUF370 domain-containing protein [Sporomusaceae bacterium FL31]|jgi:hypothetical protein|nr:DUF370 domain-containing protein [Sporomusaceae bacterium FL31]GCE34717.1 DUF370 domain-containing protein [Sporomusaceae bacterium]